MIGDSSIVTRSRNLLIQIAVTLFFASPILLMELSRRAQIFTILLVLLLSVQLHYLLSRNRERLEKHTLELDQMSKQLKLLTAFVEKSTGSKIGDFELKELIDLDERGHDSSST